MIRNNVKLLTPAQLTALKERYSFSYDKENDKVIVSIIGYNRSTVHNGNETFHINAKFRRVTISAEMIEIWKQLSFEFNLLDVQQAINTLYISYQEVTVDSVKKMIEQKKLRLKMI